MENPHLAVVMHADLHCMEEVGHQEDSHSIPNMSKHVESTVDLTR
jgi:hypothetical protein